MIEPRASLGRHLAGDRLRDEKRRPDIERHHMVEIRRRDFEKRRRAIGPGVVDQNVERWQAGDAGLHRREIGDVELNSLSRAARRHDRVARRLDLAFGASGQDDLSPRFSESGRSREAETSARAGHQRALPVETERRRAGNLRHSAACA